MTHTTLLLDD